MNNMLAVIDMQNGFVLPKTEHIIPVVANLVEEFERYNNPVVFTRFINLPNSGYVKWIKWERLMHSPEIDIIGPLHKYAHNILDKHVYSSFTQEFKDFISAHKVDRIFFCGVATESCVLKTAIDSFEMGIEPFVISDACYSHAGEEAHRAGLLVLSRNIGKNQIIDSCSAIKML